MAKQEFSKYQKKVISNYYQNLDTILLTRLQELVTELYLADSDSKRQRLWKRVEQSLDKLGIAKPLKEHILKGKDVQVLASNLEQWLRK
jgi:hypothetical protein